MIIRQFREQDRKTVVALWNDCGLTRPWNDPNKDIDRKLNFQADLFFVGEEQGEVIASAMAGYDGHRGSVFYLAVSPEHQNNGHGKQLMAHIESALLAIGCPKLNICVRRSNTKVLKFYDERGYRPDDIASLGKRLIPDT